MAVLRLATFNLLHGMSLRDGASSPETLRAALAALCDDGAPDVLALQEVDRGQQRSAGVDQTALAAEALGATAHLFVPVLHGTPGPVVTWAAAADGDEDRPGAGGPSYGVGLVSRLPVQAWHVLRFGAARGRLPLLVPGPGGRPRLVRIPDEPRAAVAAVVDGPAGRMTVVGTHLSFVPGVNVRQLRAIARWARTLPGPRVLLGDLNLPGSLPRLATGWRQAARTPTYPAPAPRVQLDHVLLDGWGPQWGVQSVLAGALDVSDHRALRVTLRS